MDFAFSPATRAHVAAQTAAFERLDPVQGTVIPAKKPAAVAIALTEADAPRNDTAFLLTKRVPTLRAHRRDQVAGAGRVLDEELGLRCAPSDVLGLLDEYPTRSGYLIAPVVVWAGGGARVRANPAEVASVHRIPLVDIVKDHVISFERIPESDRPI